MDFDDERRRDARNVVSGHISVTGRKWKSGDLLDASQRGLSFRCNEALPPRGLVRIEVRPGNGMVSKLCAMVVYVEPTDRYFRIGLEFFGNSTTTLKDWCSLMLKKQGSQTPRVVHVDRV